MKTLAAVLLAVLAVGCGSDDDPSPVTADTGAIVDSASDDTPTPPADTGAVDAPTGKPATPSIVSAVEMAGAYHVTWKLNDTGLSKVELWRSNDAAAPTLVKALVGTAKDFHDGAAKVGAVKYCWTVKTFRGTLESDVSPELCKP